LKLLNKIVPLPIDLDGQVELELNSHGLSGNRDMFEHSLTGTLKTSVREGVLMFTSTPTNPDNGAKNQTLIQPFTVSNLWVQADRGRVSISETEIKGTDMTGMIQGNIDLVKPTLGNIGLSIEQACQQLNVDLLNGTVTSDHQCP
ncbi:AsmA family protein, partial [Vibrio genomosp. F10 str. 9ZD137]